MKPILFNTEMVQAILEDRKTVTRRIIKGLPQDAKRIGWLTDSGNDKSYGVAIFEINDNRKDFKVPYLIGDILYVRETWGDYDGEASYYLYKADYTEGQKGFWFEKEQIHWVELPKWKPSIHMPKEAARIFLRVTDVLIERLQSISGNDCFREGALTLKTYHNFDGDMMQSCVPYDFFADVWNSTLKKNELEQYGWDANPYVWVYYFEVISKAEAMKESEYKC